MLFIKHAFERQERRNLLKINNVNNSVHKKRRHDFNQAREMLPLPRVQVLPGLIGNAVRISGYTRSCELRLCASTLMSLTF